MVKKAAHATPNRLLRAARKERGWTQQQVADRIGAPLSLNISRWENGIAFPSPYYLEKLCQLCRTAALRPATDEVACMLRARTQQSARSAAVVPRSGRAGCELRHGSAPGGGTG